jgi:hypothetical protein
VGGKPEQVTTVLFEPEQRRRRGLALGHRLSSLRVGGQLRSDTTGHVASSILIQTESAFHHTDISETARHDYFRRS